MRLAFLPGSAGLSGGHSCLARDPAAGVDRPEGIGGGGAHIAAPAAPASPTPYDARQSHPAWQDRVHRPAAQMSQLPATVRVPVLLGGSGERATALSR